MAQALQQGVLVGTDCLARRRQPRRALFIRRVPQALQQGVLVVHLDRAREFHAHELLGQARDVGAERRANLCEGEVLFFPTPMR